jgi:hypothetical protein
MSLLIQQLNQAYFWDVDIHQIDEEKSKRLIIERVINYGNLQEIKVLIGFYGKKEIIFTLCNLNYIDPKTLSFVSVLFHVPKTKFKCYTRSQLTNQPWNY